MSDKDHESGFHKFRPLCLSLLQKPSIDTLHKLTLQVEESHRNELENLQDHILFPFQVYLKEPSSNLNYTISVIDFIRMFSSKINIKTFFILKDILNSLLAIASNMKNDTSNEDLKLNIVSCAGVMLKSSTDEVVQDFYGESFKLPVSHLIYLTLEWAEKEKSPLLKSSSIQLLDICLERKSGQFKQIFLGLLPGISSRLVKICQDSSLQQASVKAAALKCWGGYVVALFSDESVMKIDATIKENAKTQLGIQFKALQGFSAHSEKKIREALFTIAKLLMNNSWTSLDNCKYEILNILILNNESDNSLDVFVNKYSENKEELCLEVNNILHGLVKDLEKGLGLFSEDKLLQVISLLHGYIKFLARIENESSFFVSKVHIEMFMQNLVRLAQFVDINNVKGVHEIATIHGSQKIFLLNAIFSNETMPNESKPAKYFRYLTNPKLVDNFNALCQTLGKMENFTLVVEYLSEELKNLDYFKREAMHILNQIILGNVDNENSEAYASLIDIYLQTRTNSSALMKPGQNIEATKINDHWNETLLAIEGFGYILAKNNNGTKHNITHILFYMISNISSSCSFGTAVLYFSLYGIAKGQGKTIKELLADNIEHLSRQLNLTLRQRTLSLPGIDTLLKLIINISYQKEKENCIPNDIIDSITSLTLNLSLSEEGQILQILQLILVIVQGYQDNFNKSRGKVEDKDHNIGFITRLISKLEKERKIELEEIKKAEESLDNCEDITTEDNFETVMDNAVDTEKLEPNFDQKFLKICLDHVQHFVSMRAKPRWQLTALDIVISCLDLLAHTPEEFAGERQETFLPLVHQVWSSLHLLFKSTNIFIVDKAGIQGQAFDCLLVIGKHARDFVHKRVVTDILPAMVKFFSTLDLLVKDRERTRTLAARESKRILEKMITGLWDLLALLDLSPIETDPLIHMIVQNLVHTNGGDSNQIREKLRPKRSVDANILELKLGALVTPVI